MNQSTCCRANVKHISESHSNGYYYKSKEVCSTCGNELGFGDIIWDVKNDCRNRAKRLGENNYISKNLKITDDFSTKYNIPMDKLIAFIEILHKNLKQ